MNGETIMFEKIKNDLAPKGYLRAAINMSNFLLVTGKNDQNEPIGISPDIAKLISNKLNVECKFVCFERPGELADNVNRDVWDIGNIAFERERASTINFSNPYVLIDANFLVKKSTNFIDNKEIDVVDNKIAVADRSAYDLWLKTNFQNAKIIRAKTIDKSHEFYRAGKANILAGLKSKLIDEIKLNNNDRIIKKPFTFIKQSVGISSKSKESINFINEIIDESIKIGYIEKSLKKHNVLEQLSIPK